MDRLGIVLSASQGAARDAVGHHRHRHKLARLIYSLLRDGEAYVAQGMADYEAKHKERQLNHLSRKARELGFELVAMPVATPAPAAAGG